MPPPSETTAPANKHVREFLTYYCGLPHAPNYAVLVKGPWGVGKTYVVKEILSNLYSGRQKKYAYVSLYGLSSIDEIDAALFRALYPALDWKVTKIGLKLGNSGLKRLGYANSLNFRDLLRKTGAELYVFDDFERCLAPRKQVLGYINEFTEHLGAKVVIVANEKDIKDDDYERQREKVIGRTLEVQPDFDRAFRSFTDLVINPTTRKVLVSNCDEIERIYRQSGLFNLRIVQQTIWEFERVFGALAEEQQQNEQGVKALVRLLFALSIEHKSGHLSADEIAGRGSSLIAAIKRQQGEPATGFEAVCDRYRGIDLYDTILSNEILVDVLNRGVVDPSAIRSSILQSTHYVRADSEPAWRVLWHWQERSNAELDAALVKLEAQFKARDFSYTGEFLQVVGLRLYLATEDLIPVGRDQVLGEARQCIEDMYVAGSLKEFGLAEIGSRGLRHWGGMGYYEAGTKEFEDVVSLLEARLRQLDQDRLPEKGEVLLEELKVDASLFFRRLCLTNSSDNIYYEVPILASIPPKEFVETVLDLPASAQRVALSVFKARYEHSMFAEKLISEKPWLNEVQKLFLERAAKETGFSRFRLEKFTLWNIDEALKEPAGPGDGSK